MRSKPIQDDTVWHDWFAWYPVWVDYQKIWLETIQRKRTYSVYEREWQYRFKKP